MRAAGHGVPAAVAATRLGQPFPVYIGVNEYRKRVAAAFGAWNTERGLPGDWPVPAEERGRIRSEIGRVMFVEQYDRPPADARELSGFLARASRQATTAVAGYDLTFCPVKSVSALWAIAPLRDGAADRGGPPRRGRRRAVAGWRTTRSTPASGATRSQQIDVHGLIAAAFTHRDSRAGDPDLHTHVAISNKVQALDGRWLALDGRPLHKITVAASERYNTRLEALLIARLGVAFAERPERRGGQAAGPRDRRCRCPAAGAVVGAAAGDRRAPRRAGDRVPGRARPDANAVEASALAQQATLETRQAKHEPRSFAEQRAAWRAEAAAVLGGRGGCRAMLPRRDPPPRPRRPPP